MAEAIVIKGAANEAIGVAAEYSWVRKNLPGWTLAGQEVVTKGRKVYDLMKVRSAAGEERTIYFDISDFYGKIF